MKILNANLGSILRGNNLSNYMVSSQKANKNYIDSKVLIAASDE